MPPDSAQKAPNPLLVCPGHIPSPSCPLLPQLLTISEEVGGGARGPRGKVPGQRLQLAQQAFQFRLQVLHRLLHRLEQERWQQGVQGAQEWCQVLLLWPHPQGHLAAQWGTARRELSAGGPKSSLFRLWPWWPLSSPDVRIPGLHSLRRLLALAGVNTLNHTGVAQSNPGILFSLSGLYRESTFFLSPRPLVATLPNDRFGI